MNKMSPVPAFRRSRTSIAILLAYLMLFAPFAPISAQSVKVKRASQSTPQQQQGKGKEGAGGAKNLTLPNLVTPLAAPIITATKIDAFPDPDNDGQALPGDTITYTVTVKNTGTADATGVTFTDSVDPNTSLVATSVQTQPIAVNDTYAVLGNVDIQPNAAAGLLANDRDPDTGSSAGLTASGPSTTTQGGNITINADGSFTYNPKPGFTGTDTVTYTITDRGPDNTPGTADDKTDTADATFNVAGMIWFVKAGAAAGGDGRLTTPFNCLVGAGCFDPVAADDIGDNIFLYASATPYNGGLTLLNTQKLIGQGATGTLDGDAGVTLPPNSDPTFPTLNSNPASVTITTTGPSTNGINIAAGNSDTLRGFTVGNTTGAKIASLASPPALAFGTLTVSEVILNGTGQALNLDNGTLAATFVSIASTTSGAQGINLDQISGSLTATNGTTITNPTTQCVLVTASNASMSFGNTSCSDATDGISLQNNSGANVRSFGTLSVTGTNTGIAFLHSNGGGNTTISGAASFISNGNPIDIQNSGAATINFAGGATATKTTTGGAGVNLVASSPTFESLGITTSNGPGLSATTSGTITVTNGTKAISATGSAGQAAPAILANAVTLNANFSGVSSTNSNTNGVSLTNVAGTSNFGAGSITGAVGASFLASGGTGSVTYNGTITQTIAARAVDIQNKTAGTMAFGGSVTSNGVGQGVFLNANTGATFNFTGGLNLSTVANPAFTATGGGTVSATQNNSTIVNTLTTTTGTALNVANTNIGASGLTFRSISSNGAANGIVLNTTGTSGGLTVTGNSGGLCGGQVTGVPAVVTVPAAADCTGGVILASTGAGILLTSTSNVSLTRMRIANGGDDGVFGTTVTGFTLASSLVESNGNAVGEAGLDFDNLLGTSSVTNSTIRLSHENNIEVRNNTNNGSQATLSVTGCTINNDSAHIQSDDGVLYQGLLTANMSITVSGCALFANRGDHLQATGNDTSDVVAVFQNNTLTGGHATPLGQDIVVNVGASSSGASFSYDINGNSINGAELSAITATLGKPSVGVTMSGKIRNNIIGTTGVVRSCSVEANGISINQTGGGTHVVSITGNTMRQCKDRGINTTANDASGSLIMTVQSNVVKEGGPINPIDSTGSREAFLLTLGSTATDTNTACLQLGGAGALANDFNRGTEAIATGLEDIRIRDRFGTSLQLPGYAGGANDGAAVATFFAARNTSSEDGVLTVSASATAPSVFTGGAACALPPAFAKIDDETLPSQASARRVEPQAPSQLSQPFVLLPQVAKPAKAEAQIASAPQVATVDAQQPPVSKSEGGAKGSSSKTSPVVVTGSGGTVSVNIGTLAPNDSVTITFQVIVDDPYSGPPNVSNQGTVTTTNAGTTLTDDPAAGGAADKTLTPIKSVKIQVNNAKVAEPVAPATSTPMLFTVTLTSPAPAGGVSVNFATAADVTGTHPATGGAACDNSTVDYETTSSTLNFAPGESVKTVPINVCADADSPEFDETFLLNLSGAVGGNIVGAQAVGTITQGNTPGTFLISELRTTGPNGAGDDFVELYNNTDVQLNVTASDASGGYGVYKMGTDCNAAPVLIGTVPNGTLIPARGHFLLVGLQYSLGGYAAGDVTMTSDIETDHNVAVFSTADVKNLSTAAMLDAVGFGTNTGGAVCDLLREGTTLPPIAAAPTTQHTFFRNLTTGLPADTNDNAADFLFADTQGTVIAGLPQRLGAPGPENKNSPLLRTKIKSSLLDSTMQSFEAPNRVRDSTSDPANNSTFGTLSIRRRFTNNTGAAVTRLRFRVVNVTTLTTPVAGVADVRLITSTVTTVNGINDTTTCSATGTPSVAPCSVTVQGTTLEHQADQPKGGGYNATASADVVTISPLAPGASINLQFLLGVQTTGNFTFLVVVEALP